MKQEEKYRKKRIHDVPKMENKEINKRVTQTRQKSEKKKQNQGRGNHRKQEYRIRIN